MKDDERQAVLETMTEEDRHTVALFEGFTDDVAHEITLMINSAILQEKSKGEIAIMVNKALDGHLKRFVDAGMTAFESLSLRHYIMCKVITKGKEYCFEMFGDVAGHA